MSHAAKTDLVVVGRRVVTPSGVRPARVRVADGVIRTVEPLDGDGGGAAPDPDAAPAAGSPADRATGVKRFDAGDAVVFPGVVDTHVHVNEPGRSAWEGFRSATDAAAAGGVTTLVDMPLNCSPVTTTAEALAAKAARAEGRCRVDIATWGGAVPGNVAQLAPMARAGARGFKAFLCPSGLEEFPHLEPSDLRETLAAVAASGLPLLVHAELPGRLREPGAGGRGAPAEPSSYATYLATRPPEAEVAAIELLVDAAAEAGARVHVVHLAAGAGLVPIRRARERGVAVTVETCPHYLTFAAEEIPDGATAFKCAPPIRGREDREALWEGIDAGEVDLVATDHSPCPPGMKSPERGDFLEAWGGISSLQVSLAATWTAARTRGHGLGALARWLCEGPSRLAGLEDRKGRIAPGFDADLVVWDPDAEWTVRGAELHHRHPLTPYEGRTLAGSVELTFVRGVPVFEDGGLTDGRPGRWLGREAA